MVLHIKARSLKKAEKKSNRVELTFSDANGGLKSAGKSVNGFTISDGTGQWFPADAKINGNKISVWSKKVKDPVEVRYAFTNTLIGNVSSADGLPLTPFRTGQL